MGHSQRKWNAVARSRGLAWIDPSDGGPGLRDQHRRGGRRPASTRSSSTTLDFPCHRRGLGESLDPARSGECHHRFPGRRAPAPAALQRDHLGRYLRLCRLNTNDSLIGQKLEELAGVVDYRRPCSTPPAFTSDFGHPNLVLSPYNIVYDTLTEAMRLTAASPVRYRPGSGLPRLRLRPPQVRHGRSRSGRGRPPRWRHRAGRLHLANAQCNKPTALCPRNIPALVHF